MSKTVLAALVVLLLGLSAAAQNVLVTKTDGTQLRGRLEGFREGRYRILLPGGAVREIDEADVREIALVDPADPGRPAAALPPDARDAYDRGDYPAALARIAEALAKLDDRRDRLESLAGRAAEAILDGLLQKQDADQLAAGVRSLWPSLSEGARRAVLARLVEELAGRLRASDDDAFAGAVGDVLARLAGEGALSEPARQALGDHLARLAGAAARSEAWGRAARLYQGALAVDPERTATLRAPLRDALIAHARAMMLEEDPRAAADAAARALRLDEKDSVARELFEEADVAAVRREIKSAWPSDAAERLRAFIARVRKAKHREWAEQALADLASRPDPRPAGLAAQMQRYYPVLPGRSLLYRRADGAFHERITVESVHRDGDVLKVYHRLDEVYRDWSSSKTYLVEIERDAVVLAAGGLREPILKFPLREGESWSWRSGERTFRRTVTSLGETVSVGPPGARRTFEDCLVVEFTSTVTRDGAPQSITSRSVYAPDVGLVRLSYLTPGHQKYDLELVERLER